MAAGRGSTSCGSTARAPRSSAPGRPPRSPSAATAWTSTRWADHAIPAVTSPTGDVVVADEIAPMELACPGFTDAVLTLLDRPVAVLATVHRRGDAFTDRLRARADTHLIEVTPAVRDDLPTQLERTLTA